MVVVLGYCRCFCSCCSCYFGVVGGGAVGGASFHQLKPHSSALQVSIHVVIVAAALLTLVVFNLLLKDVDVALMRFLAALDLD